MDASEDINEGAVEEWVEETTAFDRIAETIDVTREPQTAAGIANRAEVSEPTARKHLNSLADVGRVHAIETNGGLRYKRSPTTIAMRRISAIHREHTKAEIHATIEKLEGELADLRGSYAVSDVEALVAVADDEDRWGDVARWREIEDNLTIARAALSLYDFDPDGEQALRERVVDEDDGDARKRGALGLDRTGTLA